MDICWRWAHWHRGVGCLGGLGSYLMARKRLCDGSRMGWNGGGILPRVSSQSSWWMDTAECQGVVGQIILNDSMVVRTCRWLTKRLSAQGGEGEGGCISPFGFHSWLPDC